MKTKLEILNKMFELETQLAVQEAKWWKGRKTKLEITFLKNDISFIKIILTYPDTIIPSILESKNKYYLKEMLDFFESKYRIYRYEWILIKIECLKNNIAFVNWCL